MKVVIVGFGETGSCITSLLVHQFLNLRIDIIDPSEDISGRFLDIQHAATFRNSEIVLNDPSALTNADYIFYCAGVRNAKDDQRISVTRQNKDLIRVVFADAELKTSAKVIVVTNPVELITTWISEFFQHKIQVIGTGTLLDTYRFKYVVSKKLKVHPREVYTCVIGEHGHGMISILSETKINGVEVEQFLSEGDWKKLTKELKDSARNIRKTEEATKYGVAECAITLMNQFESKIPVKSIASLPVSADSMELLRLTAPVFMSQYCLISKSGVEVLPIPSVSQSELNQLIQMGEHLTSIYTEK